VSSFVKILFPVGLDGGLADDECFRDLIMASPRLIIIKTSSSCCVRVREHPGHPLVQRWSAQVLLDPYVRVVSDHVTLDFETSWGFTASGGECGEGRDQTVPLAFRHAANDPGDLVAAVRGDRVHDLLPARG